MLIVCNDRKLTGNVVIILVKVILQVVGRVMVYSIERPTIDNMQLAVNVDH